MSVVNVAHVDQEWMWQVNPTFINYHLWQLAPLIESFYCCDLEVEDVHCLCYRRLA